MMTVFWTAVVVYICGQTVYGTAGEDEPTASLASAVTSTNIPTVIPTEDESIKLVDWLTKYGYLPPPDPSTGQLQAWTAVTQAVKKMQRFAGLDDTGVLDEETIQLIQTPRCSLPDDENQTVQISAQHSDVQSERIKRAVSTWASRNINWRLRSYPASSKLSREMIRSLVYYALRVWADPTLLEFHEVRGPQGADLQIDFWNGPHGDGYPFDGAGGSVGHAFFPSDPDRAGGVHLDAEEEWTFRQPATEGTDLFTVLVHELGHALGLSHSSARQSVMRPYYQGPLGDPLHFSLGHHDLQHITALYGERGNHIPTDRPPLVTEPQLRNRHSGVHRLTHVYRHTHGHFDRSSVDRCNTSFDAVAKIRGEIFFFKGQNMWRVSRGGLVSIRAAPVQRLWSALPSSLPPLRAVMERHADHAIIFISGSEVWLFKDLSLQEGFPKPLIALTAEDSEGEWQGLHWDPAQGVVWGSVKERRGKESEIWRELIEGGVNGIITENDDERDDDGHYKGSTYVFKGNSYWKFTHPGSTPIEGYPRPLATDWLDCPQPSSYSPGDISLISHSFGRQELREQNGQRTIDQIRHKDETERDKPHHWDCPCQNTAGTPTGHIMLLLSVLFLLKSSLSLF